MFLSKEYKIVVIGLDNVGKTTTLYKLHLGEVVNTHPTVGIRVLVHEDCIEKMRLISLVDIGLDDSPRIPYSVIKEALRIEDNEVKPWVVKGITSKLLDCKIDQMNQVVIVSRCTLRVFGPNQWESLSTKLSKWRGNIAHVISTIQANRLTEDVAESLAIR